MNKQKIKKLTDREHILKRIGMYAGGSKKEKTTEHIFEDNKFIKKDIYYVPALIKIINEIIDNSIDEAIRTKFSHSNKIKVEMSETSVKIVDNGRGIPVEKNEDGEYYPKVAWGYARAGSNFDDTNRTTIGLNGVGSYITVVLSKYFKGISQDGKNKIICEWKNNGDESTYKEKVSKTSKKGVEIYFEPDFKKFEIEKFSQYDFSIIKTRLVMLSLSYPEITFYFNDEKINVKTFDF